MSANPTRWYSLIAMVLTMALLIVVGVLNLVAGNADGREKNYWPPLTMIYEVDGPVQNGHMVRETRRLDYRSATDWTDTVIESDPIESIALGTISTAGSYMRLKGKLVETYDSITDDVDVDERTEGVLSVPNAYLVPYQHFVEDSTRAPDGALYVAVSTSSKVCYRSGCEENAGGLAFRWGVGQEWIILDDERWGIVLQVGDAFIVRELILDASKN